MILRICFALFVATSSVNSKQNVPFDDETLKEIFGSHAQASDVVSQQVSTKAPLGQVTPVVPSQDTQDDDYWDENGGDKPPSAAVADYDLFDWVLTRRVASSSDKNFLMSPLGLKLALAVLMEASSQATRKELTFVLGLSNDRNVTRKKFSSIISSLKTGSKEYDLSLGSRIYLESHIIPTQRFAAIAADHYNTELKQINFQDPLEAAKVINHWVSDVTRGKITNLVDPEDVSTIVMMLINTLYFKGTWRHQFSVNDTKNDLFYVSEKQRKPVPFMNVKNRFHFVESTRLDAKILRMPYLGDNKFAMYIIVPNTHTGLNRVMEDLDSLRVDLDAMREIFVDVTIPKFKFDYTSHLDSLLKSMGVREIFEDTASLPGISRGSGLYHKLKVSKVLQRSGIEVNELGSIAYTATEFTLVNKFGEDEAQVIANRPFFFFIQDEGTRQLLFTGRVVDPESLDDLFVASVQKAAADVEPAPAAAPAPAPTPTPAPALPPTPSRLNFFDIDLLKYCAEERKGNVMVSPASIKATLAMLIEGARGTTESEIRRALRLSQDRDEFREQLNVFLEGLKTSSNGVTVKNANAIFYSNKLKLNRDYSDQLKYVYLTQSYKMNFSNPQWSAALVNQWVSNQTKGLIDSIVDAGNIDPTLEMIFANGLYFKGIWQQSFDPQLTTAQCFYDQGVCTKVATMDLRATLKYSYIEELTAHALELPYQDPRYSMILLVPIDRDGSAALIRDLPYMPMHQIIGKLQPTDVQLYLPKFTVDYEEDMVSPLKNMRISTLFSKSANLSGMFEGQSSYVDSMLHKVHMSVDEQGTVAAAATAAQVIPLIENGVTVTVDRPFVFFILDNKLGMALFEGRIEVPTPFEQKVESDTSNTGNQNAAPVRETQRSRN